MVNAWMETRPPPSRSLGSTQKYEEKKNESEREKSNLTSKK